MASRKSIIPTRVEIAICAVLGIVIGFSTASLHPGGGVAGIIGNMVGGFLAFLLLLLVVKATWRLVVFLFSRIRGV
jgi:hypothetical protein